MKVVADRKFGSFCEMATVWPSSVMLAARPISSGLVPNKKLTTPLVTPVMLSQVSLLAAANGPLRFALGGNTCGRESTPAVALSDRGLGFTYARGSS